MSLFKSKVPVTVMGQLSSELDGEINDFVLLTVIKAKTIYFKLAAIPGMVEYLQTLVIKGAPKMMAGNFKAFIDDAENDPVIGKTITGIKDLF